MLLLSFISIFLIGVNFTCEAWFRSEQSVSFWYVFTWVTHVPAWMQKVILKIFPTHTSCCYTLAISHGPAILIFVTVGLSCVFLNAVSAWSHGPYVGFSHWRAVCLWGLWWWCWTLNSGLQHHQLLPQPRWYSWVVSIVCSLPDRRLSYFCYLVFINSAPMNIFAQGFVWPLCFYFLLVSTEEWNC